MEIFMGRNSVKMAGVWTARLEMRDIYYTGRKNAQTRKIKQITVLIYFLRALPYHILGNTL